MFLGPDKRGCVATRNCPSVDAGRPGCMKLLMDVVEPQDTRSGADESDPGVAASSSEGDELNQAELVSSSALPSVVRSTVSSKESKCKRLTAGIFGLALQELLSNRRLPSFWASGTADDDPVWQPPEIGTESFSGRSF